MQTNPDTALANRLVLRSVMERLRTMPEVSYFDMTNRTLPHGEYLFLNQFNYENSCGTFACVLGWYVKWVFNEDVFDMCGDEDAFAWAARHFDIDEKQATILFGGCEVGSLEDRIDVLDRLL